MVAEMRYRAPHPLSHPEMKDPRPYVDYLAKKAFPWDFSRTLCVFTRQDLWEGSPEGSNFLTKLLLCRPQATIWSLFGL